jgi:hypothetical protein
MAKKSILTYKAEATTMVIIALTVAILLTVASFEGQPLAALGVASGVGLGVSSGVGSGVMGGSSATPSELSEL